MRYRRLGKTGLAVSEVGFGAWGIGGQMWKGGDDRTSIEALHAAVELGVNFIDTALAYGDGHSERLIGKLLKESDAPIHVATKIPPRNMRWPAEGRLEEAFPASHIVETTHRSLRNLQTDHIELTQLHVWDDGWIVSLEWYDALCRLQEEGKIRHFGISINDHQPESALGIVERGMVDTVQVIYNIFDQSPEKDLFPLCLKKDVGVIVRVPFDEGALTGKISAETHFSRRDWRSRYFRDDRKQQVERRVKRLVEDLDISLEELPRTALRFCLHPPAVSSVIAGMRSKNHVVDNTSASDSGPLEGYTLDRLRRHRWEKNFYQ